MKKLLSIALVATLTFGSINLQAGNGTKKAWAYWKIACGISAVMSGIFMPIHGITYKASENEREYLKEEIRIAIANEAKGKHPSNDELESAINLVIGGKRLSMVLSPTFWFPAAFTLIQSGRKDLRKLKEQAV